MYEKNNIIIIWIRSWSYMFRHGLYGQSWDRGSRCQHYTLFIGKITLLLLWQTMEIPFHRIQPGNILVRDVFGSKYSGKTWLADSKCHLKHRSRIFSFHKTQPTPCIVEFLSPSIYLCQNSLESKEIWIKKLLILSFKMRRVWIVLNWNNHTSL